MVFFLMSMFQIQRLMHVIWVLVSLWQIIWW